MIKYLKQLASESVIYGLSGMLSRFLSILLIPIYTRVLTIEDYGVISLIIALLGVTNALVSLALESAVHRWYWDTENLTDRKSTLASWTWCQLTVSTVAGLIIAVSAPWFSQTVIGRSDAVFALWLVALGLPFSTLGIVANSWFRLQRRPWTAMFFSLGSNLLNITVAIVCIVGLRTGIQGIFIGHIASYLASGVGALWLVRDWFNPHYFQGQRLTAMLRYAIPLLPANLSFWMISTSERYFIQFHATTREVGLYQIGSAIASTLGLLTAAFQQAWWPFAISMYQQADAKQVYAKVLLAYLWLTSLFSLTLALFAPEIIRVFATPAYLDGAPIVGILAFSYVMGGVAAIAGIGPTILKVSHPTGVAIMISMMLNLGLNLWLVPALGKMGAAIANLLSQAFVPIYVFVQSQRLYPIPFRFDKAILLLLVASVFVITGNFIHFQRVGLTVLVKLLLVLLFTITLLSLDITTGDELGRFYSQIKRKIGL
ncbi:MAG: oligosaccharide flippase family protein [Leptolyngbyaceae cyanobacterium bins.59]|nr:oligosaccharide flippase family protein [Leptolyngbyaceae cyanobacterium bins.59]